MKKLFLLGLALLAVDIAARVQAQRSQQSLDAIASKLDRLIGATEQVPAATGQHVGAAIGGAAQSASFRSRFPRDRAAS
jgi:hypothetical protein